MPHRCIFGCKNIGVLHVFPNPVKFPDNFKTWIDLAKDKLEKPLDFERFRKTKRVCDIHFIPEHRNRNNRLNVCAVPLLNLPQAATMGLDSMQRAEAQLSTSITAAAANTSVVTVLKEIDNSTDNEPVISTSSGGDSVVTAMNVMKEHNYSVISRPRPKSSGASERALTYNCHTIKSLKTQIKYLRSEIFRLRKKGNSLKDRLANVEKISKDHAYQKVVQSMKKPSQLFVHMQLQAIKKSKGRRFSIEEKILCLSLFKKSPKCCRLLSTYFTLPSSKAMKHMLFKIKIYSGVNTMIFKQIKKTVKGKDHSDRLCTLIFDEMSITTHISYNIYKDELEGFADNNKSKFADHVLVFMIKGVKQNFKQPVAYYFTNSLNKLQLKKLIETIIEYCIDAGVIIVSTICDQSQVNTGAITELVKESKAEFLRLGKEWRNELICVKGNIIVPIFDTLHIIKGIRNNLINKDIIYYVNNKKNI